MASTAKPRHDRQKRLALPPAGHQTTFAMYNPNQKVTVDSVTLKKVHMQAESFSTALALMCAMSLKDANPSENEEAIAEAKQLATEGMAIYIAFSYMLEKGLEMSEHPDAQKNPAMIAFMETCLVHQKMREVLSVFVDSKVEAMQRATRHKGTNGTNGPN